MKKKLFYTVEKELQNFDGNTSVEETTGNKTINVYEVVDGELSNIFEIDAINEDSSKDLILHKHHEYSKVEFDADEVELIRL